MKSEKLSDYQIALLTEIPNYIFLGLKSVLCEQCKKMNKCAFRRLLMLTTITKSITAKNKSTCLSVQKIISEFNVLADFVNAKIDNKKKRVMKIDFDVVNKKSSSYNDIITDLLRDNVITRNYVIDKYGYKQRWFSIYVSSISTFSVKALKIAVQQTHRHASRISGAPKKIRFLQAKFGQTHSYPQSAHPQQKMKSNFGVATGDEEKAHHIHCETIEMEILAKIEHLPIGALDNLDSVIRALKDLRADQELDKDTASCSNFSLFHFARDVDRWMQHFKSARVAQRVAELYHYATQSKNKRTIEEKHAVFGVKHAYELYDLHRKHQVDIHPNFKKYLHAIFVYDQVSKRNY